tara:strand:+ start:20718 stop:21629 length:912 start_codon:yes stop_codon:yes gene_type:complete
MILFNLKKHTDNKIIAISGLKFWIIGVLGLCLVLIWSGYKIGIHYNKEILTKALSQELENFISSEELNLTQLRETQDADMDALAFHIGHLQARLMRLDALGSRLVSLGKLDPGEFDFSRLSPLGGIETEQTSIHNGKELELDLERIQQAINDREVKLQMLEENLLGTELLYELLPSGSPIKKGWISSLYGKRIDPFTGKRAFHHGVDYAGKKGTKVFAVASGIIIRSEKVKGYGNVIEIEHPDGISTLYAHNDKNLVNEGDVVEKGQVIALLGNTGRSHGPHVHFEVRKNGKIVNPRKYIRAP